MQGVRQAFVMLILLLLTSIGPILSDNSEPLFEVEGVDFTSESLDLTSIAQHWNELQSVGLTEIEFQEASGILRLQAG